MLKILSPPALAQYAVPCTDCGPQLLALATRLELLPIQPVNNGEYAKTSNHWLFLAG
jgi:hypothetical protein